MQKIVPHVKRLNCLIVTCSMCILLKELLESDMLLCASREYEMAIFHFERVMVHKAKIWISQVVFSPRCTCPGPTWACGSTMAPAAHEVTLQARLHMRCYQGETTPSVDLFTGKWEIQLGENGGAAWRAL